MTGNQNFTVYGQRVPQRFSAQTLSKRVYTSREDAENLVTDWLHRRWLRRIRSDHYAKTKRFGRNDLAHLQPEILPQARWTQRDILNARLDDLIEQHNQRRNKDRRVFWADQNEQTLAEIVSLNVNKLPVKK